MISIPSFPSAQEVPIRPDHQDFQCLPSPRVVQEVHFLRCPLLVPQHLADLDHLLVLVSQTARLLLFPREDPSNNSID